jgi:hypothetical protein
MKKLILVFAIMVSLVSCTIRGHYEDEPAMLKVCSVAYHQVGCDNTLQITPYWKLYLVNENDTVSLRSHQSYDVGDSIQVIFRKFISDGE